MLLFGHIGFTLAAALLLNDSVRMHYVISKETDEKADNPEAPDLKGTSAKFWKLVKRTKGLDLRFVIIGSLLPDIIDKPIGQYFFNNMYGTGVLYCHTLLFVILLFMLGYLTRKSFILLLSFGSFVHLILDFMWRRPRKLLWPLFGFTFQKSTPIPFGEYLWDLFIELFKMPLVAIPELMGAIITFWFVWLLWRQKKLRSFILNGRV